MKTPTFIRIFSLATLLGQLSDSAEVIKYVEETPGAIGYINEADVRPGVNILLGPFVDDGS